MNIITLADEKKPDHVRKRRTSLPFNTMRLGNIHWKNATDITTNNSSSPIVKTTDDSTPVSKIPPPTTTISYIKPPSVITPPAQSDRILSIKSASTRQLHRSRSYGNLRNTLSDSTAADAIPSPSFSIVNQQITSERSATTTSIKKRKVDTLPPSSPSLPEALEGYMMLKTTTRRRKHSIFYNSKRKYFVQAIPATHELVIYSDKNKTSIIYALSLCQAEVGFIPNKSNAVTEHVFKLSVKTWRDKKNIHVDDNVNPQSFLFYDRKSVSFYKWIKVLTSIIKHASIHGTSSLREFYTASVKLGAKAQGNGEEEEEDSEDSEDEDVQVITTYDLPHLLDSVNQTNEEIENTSAPQTLPKCFSLDRMSSTNLENVTNETDNEQVPSESTETIPPTSIHDYQQLFHSSSSQRKQKKVSLIDRAVTKLNYRSEALKKVLSTSDRKRLKDTMISKASDDKSVTVMSDSLHKNSTTTTTSNISSKSSHSKNDYTLRQEQDSRESAIRFLLVAISLFVSFEKNVGSLLLPVALAAIETISTVREEDDNDLGHFVFRILKYVLVGAFKNSYDVFMASFVFITYVGYSSYASFRINTRRRKQHQVLLLQASEKSEMDFSALPAWLTSSQADVSRVEWLNTSIEVLWPFIKLALRDLLLSSITPLLDENKPAYLSRLEFSKLDLGDSFPVIEGVKHNTSLSSSTNGGQVVLDLDIQFAASDDQIAEVKLTAVGGTAKIKLRELSIAGTLRLYLTPLCIDWPCFSAISVTFITKPSVDFSLKAAKLNITNMPFANEWLQAFVQDTLFDAIVLPNRVDVPLWYEDEEQ